MSLRGLFFGFFLCLNVICFCQHNLRRVNVSTLPEEIRGLKDVSIAIRWTDSTGDHVVATTQTIGHRMILYWEEEKEDWKVKR